MKRLCILILCLASKLGALPVGNPAEVSFTTFSGWGFYGDYIFNRYLRVDSDGDQSNIRRTALNTNAAYIGLNCHKRLNLYGTVGSSSIAITAHNSAFGITQTNTEYLQLQTSSHFSWSAGLHALLWKFKGLLIGAEGAYFSTRPALNTLNDPRVFTVDYPENIRLLYTDWQVALTEAVCIPFSRTTRLYTYSGLKYNRAQVRMDNARLTLDTGIYQLHNLKNARPFGISIGIAMMGEERWALSVEERLVDEKAMYINGQLRF